MVVFHNCSVIVQLPFYHIVFSFSLFIHPSILNFSSLSLIFSLSCSTWAALLWSFLFRSMSVALSKNLNVLKLHHLHLHCNCGRAQVFELIQLYFSDSSHLHLSTGPRSHLLSARFLSRVPRLSLLFSPPHCLFIFSCETSQQTTVLLLISLTTVV